MTKMIKVSYFVENSGKPVTSSDSQCPLNYYCSFISTAVYSNKFCEENKLVLFCSTLFFTHLRSDPFKAKRNKNLNF